MSIVRLSRGATCSTILGQHQQTKAVLFTGVELCLHTFNVLPSPVELYSTFDKPLSILPTNSIIAHTHYTCSFASLCLLIDYESKSKNIIFWERLIFIFISIH